MTSALYDTTIREIFVAAGTYPPNRFHLNWHDVVHNLQSPPYSNEIEGVSFILPQNVKIIGGFSGWESDISERKYWEDNPSYLDGDLSHLGKD
jgi:hypothetical protein